MDGYQDEILCSACNGKCCREMPGIYYPSDFSDSETEVREALASGTISIDWWEGDPDGENMDRCYYIRPRTVGGGLVDPSYGGRCTFHGDDGCALAWEQRPRGCRMIEPKSAWLGGCDANGCTKRDGAMAWRDEKWQRIFAEKGDCVEDPPMQGLPWMPF